jgi:hypothetical protein
MCPVKGSPSDAGTIRHPPETPHPSKAACGQHTTWRQCIASAAMHATRGSEGRRVVHSTQCAPFLACPVLAWAAKLRPPTVGQHAPWQPTARCDAAFPRSPPSHHIAGWVAGAAEHLTRGSMPITARRARRGCGCSEQWRRGPTCCCSRSRAASPDPRRAAPAPPQQPAGALGWGAQGSNDSSFSRGVRYNPVGPAAPAAASSSRRSAAYCSAATIPCTASRSGWCAAIGAQCRRPLTAAASSHAPTHAPVGSCRPAASGLHCAGSCCHPACCTGGTSMAVLHPRQPLSSLPRLGTKRPS